MSRTTTSLFVGSGINSLAGAALLARAGKRVLVLERNDYLGGAIKTAEITEPGFVHEVFAGWHPLFVGSAAYAELKDDLHTRGLEYLNTELPTGTLFPDGSSCFLTTSPEDKRRRSRPARLGRRRCLAPCRQRFMPNADLAFGLSSAPSSAQGRDEARAPKAYRRLGRQGLLEFTGNVLSTCRDCLVIVRVPRVHGLLAPWVLHTGLGPDQAMSGFMTQVIAVAIEPGGCRCLAAAASSPSTPSSGSSRIPAVPARRTRTSPPRSSFRRPRRRPHPPTDRAYRDAGGRRRERHTDAALRAAACQGAAAGRRGAAPVPLRKGGDAYPHGARRASPLGGGRRAGPDGAPPSHTRPRRRSRAVNEADRGLLPAEGTIACGQPMAVDPSRAPEGPGSSGSSCKSCRRTSKGDAAGEIDVGDGTWTRELRERYADRIQARPPRAHPELESALRQARRVSPADLEARTSMVGGDIDPDPARSTRTSSVAAAEPARATALPIVAPLPRRASTHPGPGLGAGSGDARGQGHPAPEPRSSRARPHSALNCWVRRARRAGRRIERGDAVRAAPPIELKSPPTYTVEPRRPGPWSQGWRSGSSWSPPRSSRRARRCFRLAADRREAPTDVDGRAGDGERGPVPMPFGSGSSSSPLPVMALRAAMRLRSWPPIGEVAAGVDGRAGDPSGDRPRPWRSCVRVPGSSPRPWCASSAAIWLRPCRRSR